MKVLITGGAGFIGSYLAEELLNRGNKVTIIDNLSTGSITNIKGFKDNSNFHYIIDTIMNEGLMSWLVGECDVIYHLAAGVGVKLIIEKPVEMLFTNILGTEIVLRFASEEGKKVLTTSSSEIYGKSKVVPYSEDDDRLLGPTTKSRWSYSSSKAIAEYMAFAYLKEKALPVIIVRLFNIIGPRQTGMYGMVVPRFVRQAIRNEPITIYGDGKQSRTFAYVGDIVKALISLMECQGAPGQIFNLGSDEEITIEKLAKMVKEITGSKSKAVYIPYDEAYEPGFEDMQSRVPNLTKARKFIGYNPKTNLKQSLINIVEHIRTLE